MLKCYPQVYLEEYKYEACNRRNMHIDYDYEKSAFDESNNMPESDGDDDECTIDNESDNNESERPSN